MTDESFFPTATFSIMYINMLFFLLILLSPKFFNLLAFTPTSFSPHTLITYMFVHSSISHLIGNMIVLIILGFYLEKLVGKGRFLVIYIVSGITAALYDGVVRILFNVSLLIPLIGASGAIMGMAAFLAIIRPHEKVPAFLIAGTLFQFILFIFPIIMMLDAFHQILIIIFMISMTIVIMTRSIPLILFVLIQIISIIWSFFYTFSPSISYLGHFGGMVAGLLLVFLLPKKD